ncbi:MAG: hypothetical protein LUI08_06305 [Prevotella sp.]|nr:hypothetical protein [Prevotella sp.]
MERTVRLLKCCYFLPLAAALIIILCFETGLMREGGFYRDDASAEFILLTTMELLTICAIPLALRLFKFNKIKRKLINSPEGLLRCGLWRLAMLMAPLLINTLLYYLFVKAAFGYLAIILLLASVFVYPSAGRCKAEINSTITH